MSTDDLRKHLELFAEAASRPSCPDCTDPDHHACRALAAQEEADPPWPARRQSVADHLRDIWFETEPDSPAEVAVRSAWWHLIGDAVAAPWERAA